MNRLILAALLAVSAYAQSTVYNPFTKKLDFSSSGVDGCTSDGTTLTCPEFSSSGVTAGEFKFYELAANGTEYFSWLAPDAVTTGCRLRFPAGNPSGQVLQFAAASGGICAGSWVSAGGGSVSRGAYSALPGTCSTGEMYLITSGYFERAFCESANTWKIDYHGAEITAFAAATGYGVLANSTAGGTAATIATTSGAATVSIPAGGGAVMLGIDVPGATPWTRTIAVRSGVLARYEDYKLTGVGFCDASESHAVQWGSGPGAAPANNPVWYRVVNHSYNATTFTYSADDGNGTKQLEMADSLSVVLTDNGTNLIISLSNDEGRTSTQISSVSRTTWLAAGPTKICVSAENISSSAMPLTVAAIGVIQ
jgi:hypothetical protein